MIAVYIIISFGVIVHKAGPFSKLTRLEVIEIFSCHVLQSKEVIIEFSEDKVIICYKNRRDRSHRYLMLT